MSEWHNVQQLMKIVPSKRSAMGGMSLREMDRALQAGFGLVTMLFDGPRIFTISPQQLF